MNRYPAYKPSGIDWIGEIPSHWGICRLKHICGPLKSGGTPTSGNSSFYCDDGTPWVAIADMSSTEYVSDTEKHLTDAGLADKNLTIFPIGTVLYSIYATIGKVSELAVPAAINQAILALQFKNIDKTFAKYILKAQEYFVFSLSNGNTQFNLNAQKVANFHFIVPPSAEQKAIADYLDKKCGEIDALIEKQQRRITLLEELRQAHIEDIFNFDCDRIKIRFIFELRNGYTPSKANPKFWGNGTIPWFRMEDIRTNGRFLKDAIQHITPDAVKGGGLFSAGSFILATTATIGEHALLIADSLANQQFTNLKVRKSLKNKFLPKFIYYYLFIIDAWCKSSVKSTTFSQVDTEELKNQTFPVLPIDKQLEIVEEIDKEWGAIDKQIARINREIELLEEFKQSVITEVVTGKRRVCELASNTIPYKVEPHYTSSIAADPLIDYSNK